MEKLLFLVAVSFLTPEDEHEENEGRKYQKNFCCSKESP